MEKHYRKFDADAIPWDDGYTNDDVFMWLKTIETYYNQVLQSRKFVPLVDIYNELGINTDDIPVNLGWVYGQGFGYIDLGLLEQYMDAKERGKENFEFMLKPNCDGKIIHIIEKEEV